MPLAQISCFCTNKEGEEGDTEWSVLPACGHLFHTSCITKWFEIPDELGRPKKKPVCPNCRKEVNTVTIKLQGKARVPLGPIRLFFVGSPLSDPASQMTQDSHLTRSRVGARADRFLMGDVDDEIEASPEPEEQARLNPLAASERERKRLLRQHNDLLASHRVVAAERATLATRVKEMEGQVTLLKDSEKALKEEVEGLELSLDGLQDERDDDDGYPGGLSEKELRDTLQLEINSQAEELDDLRGELQGVLHELRVAGQAWDAKETEYVVERDRLKEKLSREGNSGGQRIKTLMIELNEAHAAHDRYKKSSSAAFNLAQRTHEMAIKDLEEKLDGRTRLIDNAKAGETQALLLRDKAEEKARRLESANESWTIKYNRLKGKAQTKHAPVVLDSSPERSPERSPVRGEELHVVRHLASSVSPSKRPSAFTIKTKGFVEEEVHDPFSDPYDAQDGLEQYRVRENNVSPFHFQSPVKRPRLGDSSPLRPGETRGPFLFGMAQKKVLTANSQDQHLPDFLNMGGAGSKGAAPKMKGRKGFTRR